MTTLKELQAKGGFVSAVPVVKNIKWKGTDPGTGEKIDYDADIHIRRLSVGDHEALFLGVDDGKSRTAKLISTAVTLGKEGKEKLSFEQAYQLDPGLAGAMLEAFNEVNSAKKS